MALCGFTRNAATLFALSLLCLFVPFAYGDASSHHVARFPAPSTHRRAIANITLEEAKDVVASFQAAMAEANAAILASPRKNNYTLYSEDDIKEAVKPAPYLEYDTSNSTVAQKLRLRHWRRQLSNNTDIPGNSSFSYTIPPEVAEAARIVAEANPPSLSFTEYDAIVAGMKERNAPRNNDTNTMPQVLQNPSGLLEYIGNATGANPENTVPVAELKKRAPSDFWMQNMVQRGASPFAPPGYQVWRNVKDFGARGDGVTDDTAAIQLAISSGGRCGANCGGSTVYPATVYFPPGTYLISSSLIMYYNTEMLGNPIELPRLVATSSFVGGGVIESNVYTGAQTQWYLNTNNFLRSVRNFVIDIRAGSQTAMICGIHWQVAQGTSLENIHFYMTDPAVVPSTTQQGIYMENGSGGFLSDLYFVGGKYGAYMGNQQYTSSGMYFSNAETALQLHWDWGWTMQNIVIENCGTGVTIVGGAGGPFSTGQGVGSLVLTDMIVSNVNLGIKTSLFADNSTAFLIQNSRFTNVGTIVRDDFQGSTLLAGASSTILVNSWGFGRVSDVAGNTTFVNGQNVPTLARPASLVQSVSSGTSQHFWFTRRRPTYADLGQSQLFDVKALGAKGDGSSDDTAVLNHILDVAANISAVVYFPFGVYMVSNTIHVPVGSRIIGHAWPQIMAYGSNFANEQNPVPVVRVGNPGNIGTVEIQNMMFTVRGNTAGAVLVQWNVHEQTQGSAGLWDSHFRVGGALGSNLDMTTCPKLTGTVHRSCMAASMLMHITSESSAYLENVWAWTADHYIDRIDQPQMDVFAARGILIEGDGPTWLWGTSVEHNVLYQYQISSAKNVLLGLVQTESPYFQPVPKAPAPFLPGAFIDDPDFSDCLPTSTNCASSWAVRILDSQSVFILTTGLYSWFNDYSQACINNGFGANDCQRRLFQTEQSSDIWIYNLITVGTVEMISPVNGVSTIAATNRNGFASSLLAWLGGSTQETGTRRFEGYQLYDEEHFTYSKLPKTCQNALTAVIKCDDTTRSWTGAAYHGDLGNTTLTNSVCDVGCTSSLATWIAGVNNYCNGHTFDDGSPPALLGNYILYGVQETCQKDASGAYCNTIIGAFSPSQGVANIPTLQLCSTCYVQRLKMMQATRYSAYAAIPFFQDALARAVTECSTTGATSTPSPIVSPTATPTPFCVSNQHHTVSPGDNCDSIALARSVSSVDLFNANSNLQNCSSLIAGTTLCLPLTCSTYHLLSNDTCESASDYAGVDDIRFFNPWINLWCDNLHSEIVGGVLCRSPLGGTYNEPAPPDSTTNFPQAHTGYGTELITPPAAHPVAVGTTTQCGKWYTVVQYDRCDLILIRNGINMELFEAVNPSVDAATCTEDLVIGSSYCVAPLRTWYLHWDNLGCYDRPGGGVLSDATTTSTALSVRACAEFCLVDRGYPVFGIQNGNTCICDTALNNGSMPSTSCNVPCSGEGGVACGGTTAVTVWSGNPDIGIKVPVEFPPGNEEPEPEPPGNNGTQLIAYGCYTEATSSRALTHSTYASGDNMTIENCATFCLTNNNQTIFGLEYSAECFCGTSLAIGSLKAPDVDCNMACSGNSSETCGGPNRLSLYGTTPNPPLAFKYYNCYSQPSGTPALTGAQIVDPALTIHSCAEYCLRTNTYSTFGLLGGDTCMCGNDNPLPAGVAPTVGSECNAPCSGAPGEVCGGSSRVSLYGKLSEAPGLSGTQYTYEGCYTEATSSRALNRATTASSSMTIAACANFCRSENWPLFGVEYTAECFCGDVLQAGSVVAPEGDCNMPCGGNPAETCGGPSRLNVYRLG